MQVLIQIGGLVLWVLLILSGIPVLQWNKRRKARKRKADHEEA